MSNGHKRHDIELSANLLNAIQGARDATGGCPGCLQTLGKHLMQEGATIMGEVLDHVSDAYAELLAKLPDEGQESHT